MLHFHCIIKAFKHLWALTDTYNDTMAVHQKALKGHMFANQFCSILIPSLMNFLERHVHFNQMHNY
jgi:hypothetical protein